MAEAVATSRHRERVVGLRLVVSETGVRAIRQIRGVARRDLRAYTAALLRDPCSYCGGGSEVRDHIDARVRVGGRTGAQMATAEAGNLTAACSSCNAAKGSTPLLLHLAAL